MAQRIQSGIRRSVILAASVAGFVAMAAAGAVAGDKGNGPDKNIVTARNCLATENLSYYRKCGDTNHEQRAESRHVRDTDTPTDNEPTGAAAPQND